MVETDKTMFEIYRDTRFEGRYRVVYYTELNDHNKENEISRAMAGERFVGGFLLNSTKPAGKQKIAAILDRLNGGEAMDPDRVAEMLEAFCAS